MIFKKFFDKKEPKRLTQGLRWTLSKVFRGHKLAAAPEQIGKFSRGTSEGLRICFLVRPDYAKAALPAEERSWWGVCDVQLANIAKLGKECLDKGLARKGFQTFEGHDLIRIGKELQARVQPTLVMVVPPKELIAATRPINHHYDSMVRRKLHKTLLYRTSSELGRWVSWWLLGGFKAAYVICPQGLVRIYSIRVNPGLLCSLVGYLACLASDSEQAIEVLEKNLIADEKIADDALFVPSLVLIRPTRSWIRKTQLAAKKLQKKEETRKKDT